MMDESVCELYVVTEMEHWSRGGGGFPFGSFFFVWHWHFCCEEFKLYQTGLARHKLWTHCLRYVTLDCLSFRLARHQPIEWFEWHRTFVLSLHWSTVITGLLQPLLYLIDTTPLMFHFIVLLLAFNREVSLWFCNIDEILMTIHIHTYILIQSFTKQSGAKNIQMDRQFLVAKGETTQTRKILRQARKTNLINRPLLPRSWFTDCRSVQSADFEETVKLDFGLDFFWILIVIL